MIHISIAEARTHRQISMDLPIKHKDEHFVHLVDNDKPYVRQQIKDIVDRAREAMLQGFKPELCEEGTGGTYFFFDTAGKKIGVFKPQDEEPFSINNPKGFSPKPNSYSEFGFKEGILVGEASLRECAAHLLDHDGFSGVPVTDLVLCQHPSFYSNPEDNNFIFGSPNGLQFLGESLGRKVKFGSFQEYVEHDGDTEDLGTSFLSRFPVEEVHKIAVLDCRLYNTDRHGGNILYREEINDNDGSSSFVLIPIDHGYTLPSTLGEASFVWMSWPQAKQKMSQKTKEYIGSLDAEKDIEILKQKFGRTIREEHFRVLRMTTFLLKKAAEADLTFYQIAKILCRSHPDEPSVLENLCVEAAVSSNGNSTGDDKTFLGALTPLLEAEIRRNCATTITHDLSSDDDLGIE